MHIIQSITSFFATLAPMSESSLVPENQSQIAKLPSVFFLNETSWAEGIVDQYPEVCFLADEHVRKTEESESGKGLSFSESLFQKKYIEFDRTLMTLKSLELFLDGSDAAYEIFTKDQNETVKLTKENFRSIHEMGKELLNANFEGLSSIEMKETLKAALVLGDIGKSEKAREQFLPFGAKAVDHDDFHEEVMHILENHPDLLATYRRLPSAAKKLLVDTPNLIHYGHVTHLEGGPSMFSKLRQKKISPLAMKLDQFVHVCDVAGALGHVNQNSSLAYTNETHKAMTAAFKACNTLQNQDGNEETAYQTYLQIRANWIGLNIEIREEKVLARVGSMLRLMEISQGDVLKDAFGKIEETKKDAILKSFENEISPTPTYVPAVLINLMNNPNLGETKEERISRALSLGLPLISRVFDRYEENIQSGKIAKETRLNFNPIAGLAKTDPHRLENDFMIEKDGSIRLQ